MPVFRVVTKAGLDARFAHELGRLAKNRTGAEIPAFSICAWEDDNTVVLASAMASMTSDLAGITTALIPNLEKGLVQRIGRVKGALLGMNAVAGQPVFLDVTPGLMTLTAPTPYGASIVRIGFAEPSDDPNQPGAVDLLLNIDMISEG